MPKHHAASCKHGLHQHIGPWPIVDRLYRTSTRCTSCLFVRRKRRFPIGRGRLNPCLCRRHIRHCGLRVITRPLELELDWLLEREQWERLYQRKGLRWGWFDGALWRFAGIMVRLSLEGWIKRHNVVSVLDREKRRDVNIFHLPGENPGWKGDSRYVEDYQAWRVGDQPVDEQKRNSECRFL